MDILLNSYVNRDEFKKKLDIEGEIKLTLLAMGEYNINYLFLHPKTHKKLILRVNTKSQMNLENQIEYEYKALEEIYISKRVPRVYYVDDSRKVIPYGVLVMEFLEGKPLNYESDLKIAASILADVHSVDIKEDTVLISPKNPLEAMLHECETMVEYYFNYSKKDYEVERILKRLVKKTREKIKGEGEYNGQRHCINTELNSHNFLINSERSYLIDWEKPLLGEVAQDIAHFLAPITTYWKTDIILSKLQINEFINDYKLAVGGRFNTEFLLERFNIYMPVTCLRGVTWCAMAFVEYTSDRAIKNEFTYNKILSYLDTKFLSFIESEYF